ncbi:hypothetical protein SLL77_16575 [Acinetobacter pittii]|nr:hypothetical protein [Acinetobacter pittii]
MLLPKLMHWWEQWLGEDLLCQLITTIVRQCGAWALVMMMQLHHLYWFQ